MLPPVLLSADYVAAEEPFACAAVAVASAAASAAAFAAAACAAVQQLF
jgi:hypothetical protein